MNIFNEASNDIFGDGFNVLLRGKDFIISVKQGSSDLKMAFTSVTSNKKRIDSSVLRVPIKNKRRARVQKERL